MQTYYLQWGMGRQREENIMQRTEEELSLKKIRPKEQKQIPHRCFFILKNIIRIFNNSSKFRR